MKPNELGINLAEWKDLLKFPQTIFYVINFILILMNRCIFFSTNFYRPQLIFPHNSNIVNAKKWTLFNPKSKTQSRLILLICAGLGKRMATTKKILTQKKTRPIK